MPKRHTDESTRRFEYRTGIEGAAYGGMLLEADPAGRSPFRPQLLVNTRLSKGGYIGRNGLTSYVDLSGTIGATGSIGFIGDFQIPRPITLYIIGDGCPGISSSVGAYMGTWDPEQQPEFQRALYFTGTAAMRVASYGGDVHFSTDAILRSLNLIPAVWGAEALPLSGSTQDRKLKTFASPIAAMFEFDGRLFVALNAGAGASSIRTWNGVSDELDLGTIDPPTCFASYRLVNGDETLVAGFGAATNHVRQRVKGTPPGTWTTIAPGAGTVSARNMVRYGDVLYICGETDGIWTLTDVTLALAHTVTNANPLRGLCLHNGILYYIYEKLVTGIKHVFIGSYNKATTTWTDEVIDLTLTFTTLREARSIVSYRGILLFSGVTLASGAYMYGTTGNVATGAGWVQVTPYAAGSGDITELVVI